MKKKAVARGSLSKIRHILHLTDFVSDPVQKTVPHPTLAFLLPVKEGW